MTEWMECPDCGEDYLSSEVCTCSPDYEPNLEPDYDAPSFRETYERAWEEKRRIS